MADVRTFAFMMVMDMQSNVADKDFTHIHGTVVNHRILESHTMHSQTPQNRRSTRCTLRGGHQCYAKHLDAIVETNKRDTKTM